VDRADNSLNIFDASPEDSAEYSCEADNGYGRARDSIQIVVENIRVDEACGDNPHFANCKLIVRAR